VLFARDEDDNRGDDGRDEEGKVDLDVCEEDEPFVPCALFELAGRFGAAYTAGWILATDSWKRVRNCEGMSPNSTLTDSEEKAVCSKRS
jgi:hypothetical protein